MFLQDSSKQECWKWKAQGSLRTGRSQTCQGNKLSCFIFEGCGKAQENMPWKPSDNTPQAGPRQPHIPLVPHQNSPRGVFKQKRSLQRPGGASSAAGACFHLHIHSHELLSVPPAHQATLARHKCSLCSNCAPAFCISAPFNAGSCS